MTSKCQQNLFRTANINYVLIGALLSASIISHLIANRLVGIVGFPVIPATFSYMLVFSLSDILASLNSRRFVIFVLLGEAVTNLVWFSFIMGVTSAPEPEFFALGQSYQDVFGSVPQLYLANLGGGLIISIIDILLFSHWYKTKKFTFFKASFFSTIVSISVYTYFTDYFGFRGNYPDHVMLLAHVNAITNVICVFCYSVISAWAMKHILNYVHQQDTNSGVYHDQV
ncbi:hypothetical protein D5018_19960 [Parashewanella curva]|uniref:VUT family protein n=1 Tax=Parashewanella curva TaxID=2338552 RepID=A0A3L8PRB5_9GAMM|nr:VUT family protein [Parashewanella curva]RLV57931.1 hypothetical protein D5018_19960 [Parashewanella curva]